VVFLRRDCRGNAVIEFALILPLLLLIVFGITEFGRAWMTVNVMATATREGARLAVVTGPDVPAVEQRVTNILDAANITPTSITVEGPDPLDPERKVTVTVQSDFAVIPGQILGSFTGTIPLQASTSMRHESF
jgi:Flp pilus assembly protein TadG